MISRKNLHPLLIYISFITLSAYFLFYLTNFQELIPLSNYMIVIGFGFAMLAFVFSESFNLVRIISFASVSMIIIGTIFYYKIFSAPGQVNLDYTLLYALIFTTAMGAVDVKKLLKISLVLQVILIIVTSVSFFLKIIPNTTLNRDGILRQSLGFSHPNILGLIMMCVTIEILYLFSKKIRWFHLTILGLLNIGTYFITFSRTSLICTILFIILFVLNEKTELLQKSYAKITLLLSVPITFILGVLPAILYKDSKFYNLLNDVLANRLIQGHYYIEKYGISIFGQPMPLSIEIMNPKTNWMEHWVVDSAYLRILIQHGILVLFIAFLFVAVKSTLFARRDMMIELSIVVVGLLYGVFERYAYNLFIYPPSILLFILLPFNGRNIWSQFVINNPLIQPKKKELG
ncbi:hypothetical protein [Sporolactobacillus sp. THM19-2]|uniref:hypothetical protein n=1 Tax=Sporolactobacillus sp. THM19-2 TaxID=2511171 RepID=UPI0010221A25|nr:hypothetical protein [Sporolactobacillus sp. THM19-2]RYL93956.1 hypothetical protein EWH91_02050 [Sporolactobacillus sp. THM19-2]